MWLHVLCCDANGDGTIGVLDWRVSDGPARTLEQFRKLFSPGEIAEELLEAIFGNHDEDEGRHFRSVNLEEIETEEGSVLKLSQMCLERENLRDHMDDFELIFNMLGERATTEIHRTEDSKGLPKLKDDAKAGGDIAGGARKKLEERLGKSVVSKGNYLKNAENKKLK
jgi:hypothetical protein